MSTVCIIISIDTMEKNWCSYCNESVNFASMSKLVEHFRGKKHRNKLTASGNEPNSDEKFAHGLTEKEAAAITGPKGDATPNEIVPMELHAQGHGRTYKIIADRGVIGKIVGK